MKKRTGYYHIVNVYGANKKQAMLYMLCYTNEKTKEHHILKSCDTHKGALNELKALDDNPKFKDNPKLAKQYCQNEQDKALKNNFNNFLKG